MSYRRVLVTLDGSKLAELALQHVLHVAAPGATIHLLSVVAEDRVSEIASLAAAMSYVAPVGSEAWPNIKGQPDPREVDARKKYLEKVAELLIQTGYHATTEALPSPNVVEAVVSVAERGFDVIIMATHGRTGLSRTLMGSVTEGVLHKVNCPVLVIPARPPKEETPKSAPAPQS